MTSAGPSSQAAFIQSCKSEYAGSAATRKEALTNAVALIWKYYYAELAIPESPSKSPLRNAYEELQRNDYCLRMGSVNLSKDMELPFNSNVVFLMYYKNTITNFAKVYADYLVRTKQEFQAHGFTGVEFLTEMDRMDRAVLIKKLEDLEEKVTARFPDKTNLKQYATRIYLIETINDLNAVVFPDAKHLDLTWIDPRSEKWGSFEYFANFVEGQSKAYARAQANQAKK
ncbi:MAG: hypothetical protein EOP06_21680 [Proteobacteria bacterium]|nr:MAG: hypothetical protein EOP06_21680 [Pseudomonadota bacterium]